MREADKSIVIDSIYDKLDELYPDAACTLDIDEPYFFLIRAILSAQCTDLRVNRTVDELRKSVSTPEEVLELGEETLMEIIKPCGLYKTKARNIMHATSLFIDSWDKEVPREQDALTVCPGIGRKIANLLVGELYGIPALVVDTHFKRVSKRLGLTLSDNPIKVEEDVCHYLDSTKWNRFGHLVVKFGREICMSRSPLCGICPLANNCLEKRK